MQTAEAIALITQRHEAFTAIVDYFAAKGAIKIYLSNSYETTIAITDWNRPDMRGHEICDMVDKLIEGCPNTGNFFDLKRQCNCVEITPVDRFCD